MGRIVIVFLLFSEAIWAATDCQSKLAKIFLRASPLSTTRLYQVSSRPVNSRIDPGNPLVKKLLNPEFKGSRIHMGDFSFSLVASKDFWSDSAALSDKGVWMIYNPSPEYSKIHSGHFSIKVKDTHFSRDIEEAYPQGVLKANSLRNIWINEEPYLVAQYFELSDSAIQSLYDYFDKRVEKHRTDPDYKTDYVDLPFSRDSKNTCGENCTTYLFSPYEEKWLVKHPDLRAFTEEVGSVSVSDLPYRQLHFNTKVQNYRGSVMIVQDVMKTEQELLSGKFNEGIGGAQLFFDGPVSRPSSASPSSE